MDDQDISDHLTIQRPNTKYILKRIVNFNVAVFRIKQHSKLGGNVKLPKHLLNNHYVVTLLRNKNGDFYKGDICCFRAISYHLNGMKNLQSNAKTLAEKFRRYADIPEEKFTGQVTLDQLFQIELCFDLKITVYTLESEKDIQSTRGEHSEIEEEGAFISYNPDQFHARLIRDSPIKICHLLDGHLFLDYTAGHLSVITSIENYAHSFSCDNCGKLFTKRHKCNLHQSKCLTQSSERARYIGGAYKLPVNLFQQLSELKLEVNSDDKFCPYYSSFDFETLNIAIHEDDPRYKVSDKMVFEKVLELCSCSINSSVPGYDTPFFIRRYNTEKEFMHRVVNYLCAIAEKSASLQKQKFQYVFQQIEEKMLHIEAEISDDGDEDVNDFCKFQLLQLRKAKQKLEHYIKVHVVYTWNGARFDLKVARAFLIEEILARGLKIERVIKRQSAYHLLATETLTFKDLSTFVGPGTSLEKFFQSFQLPVSKWSFPYAYVSCLSVLDETQMPPYTAFWNDLKGRYLVTEEQYNEISEWFKLNANTIEDYLREYNNRDVDSMIPGIEKLREFWKSYDIDFVHGGISLSSLSSMLMFKLVSDDSPFIWLPRKESSFVYDMAVESIVGGPALVFRRYAEKNKTTIRNGSILCKSIQGIDANALYLSCLAQDMPTSCPVSWTLNETKDAFERKTLTPPWSSVSEMEYCFWLQHSTKDPNLRHAYNYKQPRFGTKKKYRPDAYSTRDNKIYHFFGCYWHFCRFCPFGQRRAANEPLKSFTKRNEDKEMLEYFEKLGFKQEVMCECVWQAMKSFNSDIQAFIDQKLGMDLSHRKKLSQSEMYESICSGQLFGIARVSLYVPEDQYEKFKEFCPIFKTKLVTREDLSPYALKIAEENNLLKHGRKTLISVMAADKIVLITPLIQWYMENGLIIKEIFEVVQFKRGKIFTDFTENVTKHRKMADLDESKKQLAQMHKLAGNAGYGNLKLQKKVVVKYMRQKETPLGKTLEKKSAFQNIKYHNEMQASVDVNKKEFLDLEEVTEDIFEVTLAKRTYQENVPRVIGAFVLGLAKLRLLQVYYEFLDRFFDRSHWELICADTDSLYLSISEDSFEKFELLVRECDREEYGTERLQYLAMDEKSLRDPGKMKLEYSGTGIVSLSPKVYFVWNELEDTSKMSCKGINQRQLLEKDKYMEVLRSQTDLELENRGFKYKDGQMYQYRQKKKGAYNIFQRLSIFKANSFRAAKFFHQTQAK